MDSERLENLIAFVGARLPKPVREHQADDGSFILVGGDPPDVIVQITESIVLVAAFIPQDREDGRRVEPHGIGELQWRSLSEHTLMSALGALLKGSHEVRLATFRTCEDCDQKKPPEDMASEDVCRECAEAPPQTIH